MEVDYALNPNHQFSEKQKIDRHLRQVWVSTHQQP